MTIPTHHRRHYNKKSSDDHDDHAYQRYTVTYATQSHYAVLTQCWGSVWFKVLPYCLFNVTVSAVLQYGMYKWGWVIPVSDKGHTFMTLIVAFLVVTRANVSLARYNTSMGYLSHMCYNVDRLVQMVTIGSFEQMNPVGAQWRHDVVYHAMIMLRAAMGVMDYRTDGIPGWELPEVDPTLAATLQSQLFLDKPHMRWAHHSKVSENEENMRVPIRMATLTKKAIRNAIPVLDVQSELNLFNIVDNFMVAYFGMQTFLTTPFPFPLVQMTRTFLFFYVFTVPFALLHDVSIPIAHCVVIFFLTYGFMGLEYVSIELDDPFGSDDNDFQNLRYAQTTFEDCYAIILQMDGPDWADKLRLKMHDPYREDELPKEALEWLMVHSSNKRQSSPKR